MLDGVSLDQLRTFVAAADAGSFSAAARQLHRVQSAVSGWIAGLEAQLGVALFDRAGRYPRLTAEGAVLLGDARDVVAGVDAMKARAKAMRSGLEAEVAAVIDVFVPTAVVGRIAQAFARRFPSTPLRLFVEGLGAAYRPVLDGRCSVGLVAVLPIDVAGLAREPVGEVPVVIVAAAGHPLAAVEGTIPRRTLARHVQLVLTDRSDLLGGRDFGVESPINWRLADLSTKHALLREGLGWGSMPVHVVADDIAAGRLVALDTEQLPREGGFAFSIVAVHRIAEPPGPAGRRFIEEARRAWPAPRAE